MYQVGFFLPVPTESGRIDDLIGLNTTITLRSFDGTIPSLPELGRALSGIKFDVPVPRLRAPGGDDSDPDDRPHFIKDATVLSSVLLSSLEEVTQAK
jgi:hypothetical protein